jgi:hypothetical protein
MSLGGAVSAANPRNTQVFDSALRNTLCVVRRVPLNVRIAEAGLEAIDKRAEAESVERSELVRRMLAYAAQNMPKGWKP